MFKLIKNLKFYEKLILLVICVVILMQTYLEMEFIGYTEKLLDLVGKSDNTAKFWSLGSTMLMIAFVIVISIIVVSYLASNLSSKIARDLRRQVFIKVNEFSNVEINKFTTASLITRSTNDIAKIQRTLMMSFRMLFTAPCMAFFAIRKITLSSMELSWVSLGYLLAMIAMILVVLFLVLPKFNVLQKRTDELNQAARENLTGIRVIRAFNAKNIEEKKFGDVNTKHTKTNLFINRVMACVFPGMNLIMNLLNLTLYWVGARLISSSAISFPMLAAFSGYSMHVIMSFMFISVLFVMIPSGLVSIKRVNEILDTKISIKDGLIDHSEDYGTIEFREVCFKYPNAKEYVLENITFSIQKGERVAFIGSTGSGKSTIISLITRLYDATSGEILIDGIDIKAYKLTELYRKIGYVPQKANLFSGTIESNMLIGSKNATEEDINVALNVASCDFIEKLEDGYSQPVSQGGKNFSGGQKQRLSIARAIIKKPAIFIFDDSFSALDFKTDKSIRKELKRNTKDTTTLIVAQRINTILDADRIIMLNEGKIVGEGNHKELINKNKIYKEIAKSQQFEDV